jgi:plastocyanin
MVRKKLMKPFVWSWIAGFFIMLGCPLPVFSTVGWEIGDMVLDFGLAVESGESTVLVDKSEVGELFFVELTWKMNPQNCLLQTQESGGGDGLPLLKTVSDDGLFNGAPLHAVVASTDALLVTARKGRTCEIDASKDDFLVVARAPRAPIPQDGTLAKARIGAVVMIFRATTFFTPHEITIEPGQKVVWIYADGAQEPHSVTSGGCRVNDCTGGGQQFKSGLTLNKPGHRFEHVFKHSGSFPYHCDLHLGSMQGTVIVKEGPSPP